MCDVTLPMLLGPQHSCKHGMAATCVMWGQVGSPGQLPGWGIAACSGGSAALAVLCTHPADVVKTRLQVSSTIYIKSQHRVEAYSQE